jgi:hypothetical protein
VHSQSLSSHSQLQHNQAHSKSLSSSSMTSTSTGSGTGPGSPLSLFLRPEHELLLGDLESLDLDLSVGSQSVEASYGTGYESGE